MPRFAQGPPHLVLTSHGSLDPRTCRTFLVFNRGRGKSNGSLRISQWTNKSTPTVTDASHGLHMPESQNDSDKLPKCLEGPHNIYDRSTTSSDLILLAHTSGRFHLIIPGNQKTEFRNQRSNSRALLPFNQSGFERIRGVVKNNGSHQQML